MRYRVDSDALQRKIYLLDNTLSFVYLRTIEVWRYRGVRVCLFGILLFDKIGFVVLWEKSV